MKRKTVRKKDKNTCCKPVVWVGIGAIITIIIAGTVLFFLQPRERPPEKFLPQPGLTVSSQPSSTTPNIKTYTASGLYEISYPIDYFSVRNEETINTFTNLVWPGLVVISTNDYYPVQKGGTNFKISIAVLKNSNNLSLLDPDNLFDNVPYGCSKSVNKSVQTLEVLIDGIKALKRENCLEGQAGIEEHITAIKNNNIFSITVEPAGLNSQDKKLFNQILSTFKFIN